MRSVWGASNRMRSGTTQTFQLRSTTRAMSKDLDAMRCSHLYQLDDCGARIAPKTALRQARQRLRESRASQEAISLCHYNNFAAMHVWP